MRVSGHVHRSIRHRVYFRRVACKLCLNLRVCVVFLSTCSCAIDNLMAPRFVIPEIREIPKDKRHTNDAYYTISEILPLSTYRVSCTHFPMDHKTRFGISRFTAGKLLQVPCSHGRSGRSERRPIHRGGNTAVPTSGEL